MTGSDATALKRAAGGADRIVVVDTETTGVYPTDRVVEIALVTLSLDGDVLDGWDTLVQPERDVGASFIHGITAAMVANAPTFADVAGDVAVRLDGACVAAHNLPFDSRMLVGEFERLGVEARIAAGLDTLRVTAARLAEACAFYGVPLTDAHRALHDAQATAHLLLHVCADCPPGEPSAVRPMLPRSRRVLRRENTLPVPLPDPPLIAYLAARLSHSGIEADLLAYLELVDRCIGDLHLDPAERSVLADLAHQLGLSDAQIALAHRRFVNELIDAALADHQVTPDEYDLLVRVAAALGVDQQVVEHRTRSTRAELNSVEIIRGLSVVFTGDHPDHPREDLIAHARRLGFQVLGRVTKATDILVAADTDSNSGKATKARRYGIPMIAAADFAGVRAGEVLEGSGLSVSELKVISCPDCLATWTVPARSGTHRSQRCSDCAPVRET